MLIPHRPALTDSTFVFQNGDLTFTLSGLYPAERREGAEPLEHNPNQPEQPEQPEQPVQPEQAVQPDLTNDSQHSSNSDEVDTQPVPAIGDADNVSVASDAAVADEEQPGPRDPLRNAQYWVLSGNEAVEHRLASTYRQDYLGDISDDLIARIEETLRRSHSMSNTYRTAHQMLEEWLRTHRPDDAPEFHMVLLNNREAKAAGIFDAETHPHQTEPAVAAQAVTSPENENEQVALIWINKKGEPPELSVGSGVLVTDRRGERRTIGHTNPNKFPACYPILNPRGDQGWRYGLRLNGVNLPTASNEADLARRVDEVCDDDEADDTALAGDDGDLREHEGEHHWGDSVDELTHLNSPLQNVDSEEECRRRPAPMPPTGSTLAA